MYIIRRGKKILKEYENGKSAYEIADDLETLNAIFPAERVGAIRRFLNQNAFALAIRGSKARLGDGVILELVS